MLPILISIVPLMGLFEAFISKELLLSIFSGNKILDTIWGACFGSILPGNPINSYIIGGVAKMKTIQYAHETVRANEGRANYGRGD